MSREPSHYILTSRNVQGRTWRPSVGPPVWPDNRAGRVSIRKERCGEQNIATWCPHLTCCGIQICLAERAVQGNRGQNIGKGRNVDPLIRMLVGDVVPAVHGGRPPPFVLFIPRRSSDR